MYIPTGARTHGAARAGESIGRAPAPTMAMPIYEYACRDCDRAFEELILRRSDEGDVKCPKCGSRRVGRLMSRPAAARTGGGSGSSRAAPACGPVG